MRRIGVVGDGLSGLSAALSISQNGAEAVVFGIKEPLGGSTAPISSEYSDWLFDKIPIMWRRKGVLDRALRRLKAPMPTRPILPHMIAIVREDNRISLPITTGILRRPSGVLANSWPNIIKSARRGSLPELDDIETDAVNLLGLLTHFQYTGLDSKSLANAVIDLTWKDLPRVPLDGWIGASGRMLASSRLTDISVVAEGPVTGLRMNSEGRVDGVRRKGKVLPVDAVVLACPVSAKRRILKSSGLDISLIPEAQLRTVHARYLGLSGCFMRPHVVLWDSDREILAIDLAQHAPERTPREHRNSASLLHCFAYGDPTNAEIRIEAFLDAQCIGWRDSIHHDSSISTLRISDAPSDSDLTYDVLKDAGIFFAGAGIKFETVPGDHAVSTGMRAGRAASQF